MIKNDLRYKLFKIENVSSIFNFYSRNPVKSEILHGQTTFSNEMSSVEISSIRLSPVPEEKMILRISESAYTGTRRKSEITLIL